MRRFDSLTGLRFLAALWVVSLHYVPGSMLTNAGYLGVSLFFVLSGFVIAHVYGDGATPYARFIWFRVARLWPVHAAVMLGLLAAATAGAMTPRPEHNLTNFMLSLFMLNAWGFTNAMSWNYPAWSISAEFAAYLAFPAIWWGALRRPAVVAALALGVWFAIAHDGTPEGLRWALPQVACQFALGCCAYALFRRGAGGGFPWPALIAGCFGTIIVASAAGIADPWLTPIFAVLILGLAYESGFWRALLGSRAMTFWGEASYSVYLLHLPVLWTVSRVTDQPLAALAVTLVLSALAYVTLERPARRRLRTWAERRVATI